MSRRRLELLRTARALEKERVSADVRKRLIEALTAASDGGRIEDHLVSYTPDALAHRDWHLSRACDELGLSGHQCLQRLTGRAAELEQAMIAGRIDIDRPASWPPFQAWEEQLLHALAYGPMISKSRFYELDISGGGPDRKPGSNAGHHQISEALDQWKRPAQ